MKKIWVKAIPWEKELAMAALEGGADALWVPSGTAQEVKKMGLIPTVSEDGDLVRAATSWSRRSGRRKMRRRFSR